jgi:hypothetical protein
MRRVLLKELYHGNLAPADKGCLNNPKLRHLMDIAANSEEKLLELLDGEARDLFVEFAEAQTDISYMSNMERYIDGFCMGIRLAIEVLNNDE